MNLWRRRWPIFVKPQICNSGAARKCAVGFRGTSRSFFRARTVDVLPDPGPWTLDPGPWSRSRPVHHLELRRPGGGQASRARSTSGSATWTPNSTAPCATPRCRASARSGGKPADLSTDARPPAACPAASPSSAASGPAATIGPMPGMTKAIAASIWPPSSPRRAAGRESSRSTPGVASIRSARVRASA